MPRDARVRGRRAAPSLGLDRAFAARRARERDGRAAQKRCRALRGEAQRPERLRLVRRGAGGRTLRAPQARREYPHRDQEGRLRSLFPAAHRPRQPADRRLRGACALALARRDGSWTPNPSSRLPNHRADWPADAQHHGAGDEAVARLARASEARGQRLAGAIPRPDARRANPEAAVVDGLPGHRLEIEITEASRSRIASRC